MFTQRRSISAVCGYSSLSIMFLSNDSAMSRSASGSIHVVTNVAMFRRRAAVEQQLVVDQPVGGLRASSSIGHLELRDRLQVEPMRVRGCDRDSFGVLPTTFLCTMVLPLTSVPMPRP